MSLSNVSPTFKKGLQGAMMLILIVLVVMIGAYLIGNQNYDNDQLVGRYRGTANFDSFPGEPKPFDITFDGKGLFEGTLQNNSQSVSVSGTYQCVGYDVAINCYFNERYDSYIILLGAFDQNYELGSGQARYYFSVDNYSNGTFTIAKFLG